MTKQSIIKGGFLILILGLFLSLNPVNAITYDVTTTDDELDSDTACTDDTSDCSLREAITEANNDTSGDHTINIPAGTYTLSLANSSAYGEDNNKQGDLDINNSSVKITLQGEDDETTFIDGNNAYRIFDLKSEVEIYDLTITNSYCDYYYGGGIASSDSLIIKDSQIISNEALNGAGFYISSGNALIESVLIDDNYSNYYGGGLFISGADVEIINTHVTSNESYLGGGIYIVNSSVDAEEFFVQENIASNKGAGIYSETGSTLYLSNSEVSQNYDSEAIYNKGYLEIDGNSDINDNEGTAIINYSELVITDSVIDENQGYGIANYDGSLDMEGSIISNNGDISSMNAGGIYNYDGKVNIKNSSLNKNKSGSFGGAINSVGTVLATAEVVLENTTFKKNISALRGGAIFNEDYSELNIDNCFIIDNTAVGHGGAIANDYGDVYIFNSKILDNKGSAAGGISNASGYFYIDNSKINNNKSNNQGGAIYNDPLGQIDLLNNSEINNNISLAFYAGGIYNEGEINISDCQLNENEAISGDGGALFNSGDMIIDNSSFNNNYTKSSGGVIYNSNNLKIDNSYFTNNKAIEGSGGVIYNNGTIEEINNSVFLSNQATHGGSGIDNTASGIAYIYNSSFLYNQDFYDSCGSGGAINNRGEILIDSSLIAYNFSENNGGGIDNGGIADVINTTLTGNESNHIFYEVGGAIYNIGDLNISFSTIEKNYADDDGAGIFTSGGNLNLKASIISNNEDYSGNAINCGGTITSYDYNIDSDGTCALTGASDQTVNPLFDPRGLYNNGGYTKTIAIAPFSPAKDMIPEAYCTDIAGNAVTNDQRGDDYVRPDVDGVNKVCDIGAYEIQ